MNRQTSTWIRLGLVGILFLFVIGFIYINEKRRATKTEHFEEPPTTAGATTVSSETVAAESVTAEAGATTSTPAAPATTPAAPATTPAAPATTPAAPATTPAASATTPAAPAAPATIAQVSQEDADEIKASEIPSEDRATITSVYTLYLNRNPTLQELLDGHRHLMENQYETKLLVEKIQNSTEYKRNQAKETMGRNVETTVDTLAKTQTPVKEGYEEWSAHKKQLQIYETITETFARILQRYPSERELDHFFKLMSSDPSFTKERLEMNLLATAEFVRLQKLQSNVVQAELPGNVTDAQVMLKVSDHYQAVFGTKEPPKDLRDYLKSKYVAYNLNDAKFKVFLQMLKMIEDGKTLPDSLPSATAVGGTGSGTGAFKSTTNGLGGGAGVNGTTIYQNPHIYNIIHPTPEQMKELLAEMHKGLLPGGAGEEADALRRKAYMPDPTAPPRLDECERELQANQPQRLADLVSKRNADQLGSVCARNSYYMKVDNLLGYYGPGTKRDENHAEGKLLRPDEAACGDSNAPCATIDPSSLASSRGLFLEGGLSMTPIKIAQHTSVGSILPGFEYKEYKRTYDKE